MTSAPVLREVAHENSVLQPVVRRISVCYILGSLRDGGTERQAMELIRNLDRERFTVSLILFEEPGKTKIPAIVSSCLVLNVPQESSKWFRALVAWPNAAIKLYRQFKRTTPDIIHAFLAGPSILGVIPARLVRGPRFIGSRRSLVGDYRRKRRFASLADRVAFRLADSNLANSAAVHKEMISVGGCPPDKCFTLYNGVDTSRFHPELDPSLRGQMGWNQSHFVLGMVANFYGYKRHADFVDAAAIILRNFPDSRFVMIGADYGTKADVQNRICRLGLQNQIKIIESTSNPEAILAAVDVLVSTSETEGFSNVLLEAMAVGKPVIATKVGGNPEIVVDGETGFLVPVNSPHAIATVAERLIRDRDLLSKIGMQAQCHVNEHFSLQTMVAAHEKFYMNLMARA